MGRTGPMPDQAFRIMTFCFRLMDLFSSPLSGLDKLGLKPGDTVIDYGCGPGRYIKKASQLVGREGRVYAVDIHHLAVRSVQELVRKEKLTNVVALQACGFSAAIPEQEADVIYAFDMFHMIEETAPFLQELHRLLKPEGYLFIDPGHQSSALAREKILASGLWNIVEEASYFKCKPEHTD